MIIASVVILLVAVDRAGLLLAPAAGNDQDRYHDRVTTVTRVIDGDTIEINLADAARQAPVTRIRLWGIDCPEAAREDRAAEPWSGEATARVIELVVDRNVRLALESHQSRDRYHRVLAHVILEDGQSLATILLREGLARADDRWPHARLKAYAQVEADARRRNVGLWMTTTTSAVPGEVPTPGSNQ